MAYRNSPNNAISLFPSDTLCILWHNSKAGVALFSVFGSHRTESFDFIGRVALCIGAWIGATCWLILYASYLMSHASFLLATIVSWYMMYERMPNERTQSKITLIRLICRNPFMKSSKWAVGWYQTIVSGDASLEMQFKLFFPFDSDQLVHSTFWHVKWCTVSNFLVSPKSKYLFENTREKTDRQIRLEPE